MVTVTIIMKVQLIHWDVVERRDKARKLRSAGYRVVTDLPAGGGALRKMSEYGPVAISAGHRHRDGMWPWPSGLQKP